MKPHKLNFSELRCNRQVFNNTQVYDLLFKKNKTKGDVAKFKKSINIKELDRVEKELNKKLDYIFTKCEKDEEFARVLAGRISKVASRQGNKDEEVQINTCGKIASKCGIQIKTLSNTAFRPTKSGKIVSTSQFKKLGISKADCLKSFDAKVSGKIKGWIFAKITFSHGGHQDNVFEEARNFCEWVIEYGESGSLYIVLIDTDLEKEFYDLKKSYSDKKILIANHIELQRYFITNFYTDDPQCEIKD